ncbi:MAG TPA: UbiA family prenyltransferase [Phycisphaerae bacterium]|nr:UbiA family prenyltransferase [Phycisphaerae bacterium]
MKRLLAVLQLMRVALALTAVADAWTLLLMNLPGRTVPTDLIVRLTMAGLEAFFLYSFGMTLNDLLDARRDRLFASWRPIPSGKISPPAAIILSIVFLMLSLFFAAMLDVTRGQLYLPGSLLIAFSAAMFIVFYNSAGKFLGSIGLVSLGMIRALNSTIGRPDAHFLLLCMFLFTHITLAGTLAYHLESKRPRLKNIDIVIILANLLVVNGLMLSAMIFWKQVNRALLIDAAGPALMLVIFYIWAVMQASSVSLPTRQRGERIMLVGLFWLFCIDAAMLLSNGQFAQAGFIAILGIVSLITFFLMRLLGRGVPVRRPSYRLLETKSAS